MCLIIHRPAEIAIPQQLIDNGLADNPDGWGIMVAREGRIEIVRGLDPGHFIAALEAQGDSALAIHFRYATHGSKSVENCHPFTLCSGAYAVMHNGILSDVPEFDRQRSDTYHFASYILEPMLLGRPEWFGRTELEQTLADMIGAGNKLVILDAQGETMIVNRKQGVDHAGLWLSNSGPLRARKSVWFDVKTDWSRRSVSDVAPRNGSLHDVSDDEWFDWEGMDEGERKAPAVKTDDDDEEGYCWSLEDCAYLTRAELVSMIEEEPDLIADLIRDHFDAY